ncbi:MAG: DMT family transporter [Chlorobi bacterium]|nr:DMT family transporter [Chlorobiota bacterium]
MQSESFLMLTAIIWGLAFVAQRMGMDYIGPFAFNGIRFALGAVSLLPFFLFRRKKDPNATSRSKSRLTWIGGLIAGMVVFMAAGLQQVGIVYTTAGNAGFITSLYIIIVPLLGLFRKHRISIRTWTGALVALAGLYFLSVTQQLTFSPGDGLVLFSAVFWALHVLVIGDFAPRTDIILLSIIQFLTCSVLSMSTAFILEKTTWQMVYNALIPILYGGIMSVGVAYTFQIMGQRFAPATHAAIILSTESLFAALGGWLILSEVMTSRQIAGALLMLTGVIISQIRKFNQGK